MLHSGVYIGSDLEMVVTENYIVIYRRNKPMDFLESRLYKKFDQTFLCIGICQSSPVETEQFVPPLCWKTAFLSDGKTVCKCKKLKPNCSASHDCPPEYENIEDNQLAQWIGTPFDFEIQPEESTMVSPDGIHYAFLLDEEFTDESLRPALPSICADNVGVCLRIWNMGIQEEYLPVAGKSQFIGITINTEKHMYIFELSEDFIYCRAARFVATNRGVVFNQNFRQGFEAYMIADNMEAHRPLSYDASLFSSDSCLWNNRSVYWSLHSYNDQEIILHGCQGDIYHWKKPVR